MGVVLVNSNNMNKLHQLVHLYSKKRDVEKKITFFSLSPYLAVLVALVAQIFQFNIKEVLTNAE